MLAELCKEIRNWFETDRIFNTFTIENHTIDLSEFVQDGQYFRIVGSVFNDGVYQYPVTDSTLLKDETFDGAIWPMAVPSAVIDLATEIGAWLGKYGAVVSSPYLSESWMGYSYSKASGDANGNSSTWQSAFAKRLNQWRKI